MYEDKKTISVTENQNHFDAIEYGLIAGGVFVISTLVFAAVILSELPGF